MPKFDQIPIEPETRVMYRKELNIGQLEAMFEMWSWDGIHGHSVIFRADDIAEFDEVDLITLIRTHFNLSDEETVTVKSVDHDYTFVNFRFES